MPKQIYHPYWDWEDFKNGMWGKLTKANEEIVLPLAVNFTKDHILYGGAMLKVIDSWPISCEHNLSNVSINRKAWIGHAACCLEFGWPEYIVRKAWWYLTDSQRTLADNEALKAIKLWEQKQRLKSTLVCGKEGATRTASQMMLLMN